MSPLDVFDPSAALDPTRYAGQAGAAGGLHAAQQFPRGPLAPVPSPLFSPIGPRGLPVPRFRGWAAAITGDLLWFAVLLGTSLAAASIADDDRCIALVMIAAMIVIPRLARRFVPALRPNAR